jgi:RNA polymerase sigma factor (TIGR02999 family)
MRGSGLVERPGAVTALLVRLQDGDRTALDDLMDVVYAELRHVARNLLRRERPDHVLQPTALVHEAYLRLVGQDAQDWRNRAHFFGAAAHLMRRILVDHARASRAKKRSGATTVLSSDLVDPATEPHPIDLLALNQALDDLQHVSARQARVVELRCFGGLSVPEAAEVLGMNPRTVDRDWTAARVWLRRRLRP